MSPFPVTHPLPCRVRIAPRDGLTFVADAVHSDDTAAFHEEPDDAGIQFADVPQFKKAAHERDCFAFRKTAPPAGGNRPQAKTDFAHSELSVFESAEPHRGSK